ncbi:MAG: transcription antitermination factor NusB [Eubacteriales bacterium]|nr:transcription antitermination factor NusB [Clostridiales bacterium]MDY2770129.1 transcription antitermination factor NusB [Eubacteriales bacterium]
MKRSDARECAMKLVYEWEMGGDGGEDTRLNLLEIQPDDENKPYVDELVAGVQAHADEVDRLISAHAIGWSLERITRVDLAILRLAAYEMKFGGTPSAVAIDEAVEMAKKYSTEKAGTFINGVLGAIMRSEIQ